jgi:putative nucleotidyltransferase with HDIG domain
MVTSPQTVRTTVWEKGCHQLLHLATELTGSNHGAFLQVDLSNGSLRNPEKKKLPQEYWEAARAVARNPVPLLFHGNEGKSSFPILAVPVQHGTGLLGVLVIADRPRRPLDRNDLNLVSLLVESPSLANRLGPQNQNSIHLLDSIKALLQTLEARDHYTGQHSSRVTKIASHFGRTLGLSQGDLAAIKTAGLLHDLGKVGISDAILLKNGPLTQEECSIMRTHPVIGANIVRPLGLLPQEMEIILHHHERWDGRGYPYGLAEGEIPFLCRLVALADAFDALTSDRPYRSLFPVTAALEEIAAHAGTHFDPVLAGEFIKLMTPKAT